MNHTGFEKRQKDRHFLQTAIFHTKLQNFRLAHTEVILQITWYKIWVKWLVFSVKWVENIFEKGENACNQNFFPTPTTLSMSSTQVCLELWIMQ